MAFLGQSGKSRWEIGHFCDMNFPGNFACFFFFFAFPLACLTEARSFQCHLSMVCKFSSSCIQSDTKDMVPHRWLWAVPGVGGSELKISEILQFSEV